MKSLQHGLIHVPSLSPQETIVRHLTHFCSLGRDSEGEVLTAEAQGAEFRPPAPVEEVVLAEVFL